MWRSGGVGGGHSLCHAVGVLARSLQWLDRRREKSWSNGCVTSTTNWARNRLHLVAAGDGDTMMVKYQGNMINTDQPGKQNHPASMHDHEQVTPSAEARPEPVAVPVFNCLVYVSRDPSGNVRARVVNLAGLECTAGSEREALGRLVPAFKQRVGELMQTQTAIPWIEPPPPVEPGEQQRFIPVHL